jgi:hypothetical protein
MRTSSVDLDTKRVDFHEIQSIFKHKIRIFVATLYQTEIRLNLDQV